ncbi:hypothetical protein [uncultured Acinetobacter sp.]|uniref:hypothetical protein n=1 Tax=uncultured Acinetobacter sp. TaxID=165433 RepID=UPI002617519B|nr:hypothetical protein [uncultured Acinetobacter sp.]
MSYSLKKTYESLEKEILQLNAIVNRLSITPESMERDVHIEGCFIRLVVSWEIFIEEYFLRCMCKAKTRTNKEIKPISNPSKNINDAFKKINKNRKDRDKDFTDWLDSTLITHRVNDYFRFNSRLHWIYEAPDKLFELKIIRNAIAHRSVSAISKFEKYVKDQMGYLANINPSMASLLIQKKRNSSDLIFSILSNYFLDLADRLTK